MPASCHRTAAASTGAPADPSPDLKEREGTERGSRGSYGTGVTGIGAGSLSITPKSMVAALLRRALSE